MASLVQLGYALALAEHKSFQKAARASFVTQPTLSMQIQKLEEEYGVVLFDRSRQPIALTDDGEVLVEQFRRVVAEYERITTVVGELRGEISGDYRLGVIPTIAPYLLPLFLARFHGAFPKVRLTVEELTTDQIITRLREGTLDAGILATPLNVASLAEQKIYNEPFLLYHSADLEVSVNRQGAVRMNDLPLEQIIVMGEGHCLRTQVLDLCAHGAKSQSLHGFRIVTGSMATLIKMVDQGPYFTILPQLALADLPKRRIERQVKPFADLVPYREVGLVTYRTGVKANLHRALLETITRALPRMASQAEDLKGLRLDPLA